MWCHLALILAAICTAVVTACGTASACPASSFALSRSVHRMPWHQTLPTVDMSLAQLASSQVCHHCTCAGSLGLSVTSALTVSMQHSQRLPGFGSSKTPSYPVLLAALIACHEILFPPNTTCPFLFVSLVPAWASGGASLACLHKHLCC